MGVHSEYPVRSVKSFYCFVICLWSFDLFRSGNMGVIINQLHRLNDAKENEESMSEKMENKHMPTVADFDVESVCSFLTQANEVR